MAFIEPASEDEVVSQLYEADREDQGYVANSTRAFSHRPEVYDAWRGLVGAIRARMDLRRYELVTLAAARRLRSTYCALAHGSVLAERFHPPATVRALALDGAAPELDEVDLAVVQFAERVVDDATSITQADVDRLRSLGLSDADVVDVALAAAVRCFFSKTLDALGVQADAKFEELEPGLREALTVGRPISSRP